MSIESIFTGLQREITRLKATVEDLNRRVVVAPLNAGKSKQLTIASGSIAATRPFILLTPESGTADDLATIDNGSDGKMVVLMNAREGDTVTILDYSSGGAANIDLGGATFVLDNVHDSLVLIYRESTAHWERVGLSSAGGGGAVDSVNGQTGAVSLDSDDVPEGIDNLYLDVDERIKLAGVETNADVTDQANVGAAIDGATEATTVADANKFALIVGGALRWLSWTNLKAAIAAYFATMLTTAIVRAASSGGLRLEDDAGNLGLFIQDGTGNVGVGVNNNTAAERIKAGGLVHTVIISEGSASGRYRLASTGAASGGRNFEFTSRDGTLQISSLTDDWSAYIQQYLMVALPGGNMGFGVVAPQGRLHVHDGTAGWLKVSKTGVGGTAVTVVPNGTGDCLYRLEAKYVVRASDGTVTSGSTSVNNGLSNILYSTSDTLVLGVNADGSIYLQRTVGTTLTFTVALDMVWL